MQELKAAYTGQPSDGYRSEPSTRADIQGSMVLFRALPLLSSDLHNTTVNIISHSFVDLNNRGKKELSIIVFVKPGLGKDGWKVKKMYSDILGLHQRVRYTIGKGAKGKIANLPQGKFWNASPAKLDQSKAVLEKFLQTLIRLPVKNNDEVIAFFTSNLIREQRQIGMQVGHEGYLTKKGKNFWGWKTRFFILQGPVLEYYDFRGGVHLDSILITGAQIARQTRERPPNTADETEYRHAFLIVEAKKDPAGVHRRHILCAGSDEDRDIWVEMLVHYYTDTYSDEMVFNPSVGLTSVQSNSVAVSSRLSQPRSSTSPSDMAFSQPIAQRLLRDDAVEASIMPVSLLPPDTANATLVHSERSSEDYPRSSSDKLQLRAAYPPRAVFGVLLEEALDVAQICNLPALVFRSIQYLEAKKAYQEEGIYFSSGSFAVIKSLKDMFINEGDIDLLASDEYWDPHAIAGLLKSFLRELPSSILTADLRLNFLAVMDLVDPEERIEELSHLISALPLANYSLLRALTAHLNLIVKNSNVNKMSMRNVVFIFSPILSIHAVIFSLILGEFSRVFDVDSENDEVGSLSSSPYGSAGSSFIDSQGPSAIGGFDIPTRMVDRSLDLPSSPPDPFPLSITQTFQHDGGTPAQRSGSEVGNYPDFHGGDRYQRVPSTSDLEYATAPRLSTSDQASFDYDDRGRRDAGESETEPEWHTNSCVDFASRQEASHTPKDTPDKCFGDDSIDDLPLRPDSRSSGYSSSNVSDAGTIDPTIHPNWRSKISRRGHRPLDLGSGSLSWHISSRRKAYAGSACSGSSREAWKNDSGSVSDDAATITSCDH